MVALALGGCSFSYSSGSGSRTPSNHSSHANHGKPVHKTSSGKIDNREKALPSSSGEKALPGGSSEKPITKGDAPVEPDAPAKADTVSDEGAHRIKTAPHRTTGAPKRTPSPDDTVEAQDGGSPAAGTSFKAKPAPKTPPTASDTIVAPH